MVIIWSNQAWAVIDLAEVPLLDMKSEAKADSDLQNASFSASKQYCFSDSIPKHFVIPETQDPVAETLWYAGSQIKVKISRGAFPSLIGMSKSEAEAVLQEENLTYVEIDGRNDTVRQGFIFDQEPKEASCYPPKELKLFVNAPLSLNNLTIEPSKYINGETVVPSTVRVQGRLSSPLKRNEHLWIAVKPFYSTSNWWPQTPPGDINLSYDRTFEGNAYLGGNDKDLFEIAVLILDNETNERFKEWENYSSSMNNWPAITDPTLDMNVSKAIIDAQVLESLEVKLNQYLNTSSESLPGGSA